MRTLTLFITMMMVISTLHLNAQRNCASKDMVQIEQDDPKHAERLQVIEQHTQHFIENNAEHKSAAVITIPIVFHVVYRTSAENISDAELMSQLQVLNDDFRRLNSDTDGTWSQAADTEIQFCLATVDPNGNPTTGITRTSTSTNGFGTNDAVKFSSNGGKDAWPRNDYLNFWVCNIGGGILGYAQFPGGSAATDGVVNDYRYTGTIGSSAPFNLGRTATHEVGHWLNLRHIWGDGNCNADDFVSDTPTSDAANYGCATGHVSCNSTDMVQNYMDYSDDGCMNLFTQGQKDRMLALFAPGGARVSLLSSAACGEPAEPTCDDGVQNGDETGVDCGGSCPNECPPEPTCDDGVQNGDETGVDCGGSCGNVCPCDGNPVVVTINLDNYPEETSWAITDANGGTVASGGTYGNQADGSTVSESLCLGDGCYTFTISDRYGDGICCSYGNGSYSVTGADGTLASGASFGSSEATDFCFDDGPPAPTCDDGVQNGDEEGVDCGGSSCPACPTCDDGVQNGDETGVDCGGSCAACATCDDGVQNGDEEGVDCGGSCPDSCGGGGGCTYEVINSNNFDSGWGIWNDGGSDCRRSTRDAAYANSGNRCVRLRDNTSTSTMTTDNLDLSGYDELTVDFSYIAVSMDNANEDFWLQISTDGGASFTTVEEWNTGDEFENNVREDGTATIAGSFSANTQLRFRCDASGNSDWVYIDDVVISGCANGNNRNEEEVEIFAEEIAKVSISGMNLFPNPANNYLNVEYTSTDIADVQLFVIDMTGKVIQQRIINETIGEQRVQLDINQLSSGFYFVQLVAEDTVMSMKFVKP